MSRPERAPPTLEFTLPTSGVFTRLPASIAPYIEITRMHIPPLNLVCYYPFVIGIALVARETSTSPTDLLVSLAKAYPVALLSGAAGHVVDDVVDYTIDVKYPRCRSRPIIRGAMTWNAALRYAIALLLLLLCVISLTYGAGYSKCGMVFAVLAWAYPASKRFSNYPQLVLLFLHSSPIPWIAMAHNNGKVVPGAMLMAAAFGTNTMIFDVGYGLLDAKEDLQHGVGSMAARFHGNIKSLLTGLSAVHVIFLVLAGSSAGLGGIWYISCVVKATMLAYLIHRLDPNNTQSGIEFMMTVSSFGGAQIILSLFADYAVRYWMKQ